MKALLLDVDRTLVDLQSFTDYTAANEAVAAEFGAVQLDDVPDTDWGSATQTAMATLVSLSDRPDVWRRASDIIESFEIAAIGQAVAMPGLAQFMKTTADIPRALATLMGQGAVDELARRFGVDVAIRIGRRVELRPKPAADQILAACAALDVFPGDAVFVGDSSWDEVAAFNAGVRFIGITNDGPPSQFTDGAETVPNLNQLAVALGIEIS